MDEQSRNWDRLSLQMGRIDEKIESAARDLASSISARYEKLVARIEMLDAKFDHKFDSLDQKFDRKFDDLRAELSRQFRWTVGIMITLGGGLATLILQ